MTTLVQVSRCASAPICALLSLELFELLLDHWQVVITAEMRRNAARLLR